MNKLVSIILPNYNHAPFLKERLDSIFNQSYQDFEVIILDDCSTDSSLQILEPYRNHPKVSHFIVNKENTSSPFKQWKKGLDLVKGDFVWIAESDDFCDLDFLVAHVNNLKDPEVKVSVATTVAVDPTGKYIKEAKHHLFSDNSLRKKLIPINILKIPILNVSSICFKKEALNINTLFFNYSIIGDRVFYQENFLNRYIQKASNTQSYFRRLDNSVSNFDHKSMKYKKAFFEENLMFIRREYNLKHIDKDLHNKYLIKFFNKVKNRTSKREKFSFSYGLIFLKYKFALKQYLFQTS